MSYCSIFIIFIGKNRPKNYIVIAFSIYNLEKVITWYKKKDVMALVI